MSWEDMSLGGLPPVRYLDRKTPADNRSSGAGSGSSSRASSGSGGVFDGKAALARLLRVSEQQQRRPPSPPPPGIERLVPQDETKKRRFDEPADTVGAPLPAPKRVKTQSSETARKYTAVVDQWMANKDLQELMSGMASEADEKLRQGLLSLLAILFCHKES